MLKNSIPFVDLRGKTLIDLLRMYPDKAQELIKTTRRTYGMFSNAASACFLPWSDKRSHAWLKRTKSPFLYEIESFAEILDRRGVYTLNLSYEWACTTGAYQTGDSVTLLRVLDWPFKGMGKHVMVVLQKGKAGEYYNVTWPALSGVYNAMAPQRFAAAINQAPMRMHGLTFVGDWYKNRLITNKAEGLPPAHLLRQVFEQADSYETAKQMLIGTPIAMPAIYTLTGTKLGQGCIIERFENNAEVLELHASRQLSTSNHFNSIRMSATGKGWWPRAEDSEGRYRQSCSIHGHDMQADHFEWLKAPMINQLTRLCMITDASTKRIMVQGYEGMTAITDIFNIPAEIHEQYEAV